MQRRSLRLSFASGAHMVGWVTCREAALVAVDRTILEYYTSRCRHRCSGWDSTIPQSMMLWVASCPALKNPGSLDCPMETLLYRCPAPGVFSPSPSIYLVILLIEVLTLCPMIECSGLSDQLGDMPLAILKRRCASVSKGTYTNMYSRLG